MLSKLFSNNIFYCITFLIKFIRKFNELFYILQLLKGYHKKELSMIGEGCDLGDKVTVKQCSIGKGSQIGAKSKLNNCIIMDHTIIGER